MGGKHTRRNKMIVVSGCPRSGTSLMMDLLRVAFGKDRIVGSKFPQEEGKMRDDIPVGMKSMRAWLKKQQVKSKDFKDMNPKGFWECEYSVQGIVFNPRKEAPSSEKIVKIVSQGMAKSDPQYIDKVIFMLRHPRAVAKSQERLGRPGFNDTGDPEKDGKPQRIHTAQMFNQVTHAAAWWLDKYKIPYITIEFDDLIENPAEQMERVREFLGEGDFAEAIKQVEPSLRRSIPQDREGEGWDIADKLYELFLADDLDGIVSYIKEVASRSRPLTHMNCARMKRRVAVEECTLCQTEPNTKRNFMLSSVANGVCWDETPCAYDCLVNNMTVEESLASTTWADILTEDEKQGKQKGVPCSYRDAVTKTVPCCRGKTRPVAYKCTAEETPDEMATAMCNSQHCRFYTSAP